MFRDLLLNLISNPSGIYQIEFSAAVSFTDILLKCLKVSYILYTAVLKKNIGIKNNKLMVSLYNTNNLVFMYILLRIVVWLIIYHDLFFFLFFR